MIITKEISEDNELYLQIIQKDLKAQILLSGPYFQMIC